MEIDQLPANRNLARLMSISSDFLLSELSKHVLNIVLTCGHHIELWTTAYHFVGRPYVS